MKPSISMVFPAYNEALNLEDLVAQAFKSASANTDDFEIIVVDDGSVDNTRGILNGLKQKFGDRLRPIHIFPNKGYANALRTGFLSSAKELVFYSDADNQFDLSEISLLIGRLQDNDMVIGYRIDRKDNWFRIFVSKGYNLLIRVLFGIKVKDVDCAFKLFRREIFSKIKIEHEKFLVDTEILAKAGKLGMKWAETGVKHLPRTKGRSTVKPSDVLFTLKGLFKLKKELIRS